MHERCECHECTQARYQMFQQTYRSGFGVATGGWAGHTLAGLMNQRMIQPSAPQTNQINTENPQ